jgi:hypothetical protein
LASQLDGRNLVDIGNGDSPECIELDGEGKGRGRQPIVIGRVGTGNRPIGHTDSRKGARHGGNEDVLLNRRVRGHGLDFLKTFLAAFRKPRLRGY